MLKKAETDRPARQGRDQTTASRSGVVEEADRGAHEHDEKTKASQGNRTKDDLVSSTIGSTIHK